MTSGQVLLHASGTRTHAIRAPLLAGVRDIAPALVALAPLALTVGAAIATSPLDDAVGWAGGAFIYGASAHVSAISLLGSGASGVAVVLTVLVLTARGVVYSAGLLSRMQGQPAWFRWGAPYFLVDPVYALITSRTSEQDGAWWVRWYYLGAAVAIWLMWMPTVGLGILVGPVLPDNAGIDFALPALLIAFLVPGLRSRPAVAAAVAGASVGVVAGGLPSGLGLLLGAASGTAVAMAYEWRTS